MKTIIAFLTVLFANCVIFSNGGTLPIGVLNTYIFSHDKDFNGILDRSELSQMAPATRKKFLDSFDANKDGQVSLEEVLIKYKIDRNNDGYITIDELRQAVGDKVESELFKNVDLNGDGMFDIGELRKAILQAQKFITAEAADTEESMMDNLDLNFN